MNKQLCEAISFAIKNGEQYHQMIHKPSPIVNQGLKLADILFKNGLINESKAVLKTASDAYIHFSNPIYIIKEKNEKK